MRFSVYSDELTVMLEGSENLFGLKHRLAIPTESISDISWYPHLTFTERIWRLGGTGIPGLLYAGHFYGHGERYYLYLYHPHGISWVQGDIEAQNTLVITTQDYVYKQILLSCDSEPGKRLVNWWQGISSPRQPSAPVPV